MATEATNEDTEGSTTPKRTRSSSAGQPAKKLSAGRIAAAAGKHLSDFTGRHIESVTGLKRQGEEWEVQIEVVEARRIPDSADILALYEVLVDNEGELTGYRRLRRYARGRTGEE